MAIELENIQRTIDYEFENVDLLEQAFVRRSFSSENGGQNNEVLEFIGDKALDLAVIRIMMERYSSLEENKGCSDETLKKHKYLTTSLTEANFTEIKKKIVEKKSLAKAMDSLGFYTQLIMGKGDLKLNIQNETSVKEDLFESILGAIAVDCEYDMDVITRVVNNMLDIDELLESEEVTESTNYVGKVQEYSQKNGHGLPIYTFDFDCHTYHVYCTVEIDGTNFSADGEGASEHEARMDACKELLKVIKANGENKYFHAIGKPDRIRAIAQLNELYQKGIIEDYLKPEYKYEETFDEDGNPIWKCTLEIGTYEVSVKADAKRDAQRFCVYHLLCYLTDLKDEFKFEIVDDEDLDEEYDDTQGYSDQEIEDDALIQNDIDETDEDDEESKDDLMKYLEGLDDDQLDYIYDLLMKDKK